MNLPKDDCPALHAASECHICHRPLNEPGELYCSAAHPLPSHAASTRRQFPELTPEVRLARMTEIADAYRIEADCAMRDYDGLAVDAGIMCEALRQIADARPNKTFDPWARELARAALAQVSEKVTGGAARA